MKDDRTEIKTTNESRTPQTATLGLWQIVFTLIVAIVIVAICVYLSVQSFTQGDIMQGVVFIVLIVLAVLSTTAILVLNHKNSKM